MRLWCWYCHKSVSSELPNNTLFRAIAVCPECIAKSSEADNHPLTATQQVNAADTKKTCDCDLPSGPGFTIRCSHCGGVCR